MTTTKIEVLTTDLLARRWASINAAYEWLRVRGIKRGAVRTTLGCEVRAGMDGVRLLPVTEAAIDIADASEPDPAEQYDVLEQSSDTGPAEHPEMNQLRRELIADPNVTIGASVMADHLAEHEPVCVDDTAPEAVRHAPAAPAYFWQARYSGPDGVKLSPDFPDWTEAANWLRAILDVIHPERSYPVLVAAIRAATPDIQVALADGSRRLGIIAVDAAGEPVNSPPYRQVKQSEGFYEMKAAKQAKKAARKDAPKAKIGGKKVSLGGKNGELLKMLQRKNGVSEKEGCERLGWKACGATILRVIAAAEANRLGKGEIWKDEASGRKRYAVRAA